jgi:CheY-like chemotaxis protein
VLIIERRRGAHAMLERDLYDVVPAHCGRAGGAALQSARFDLVICDVFMPDMDGIETIHAFHSTARGSRSSRCPASCSALEASTSRIS